MEKNWRLPEGEDGAGMGKMEGDPGSNYGMSQPWSTAQRISQWYCNDAVW